MNSYEIEKLVDGGWYYIQIRETIYMQFGERREDYRNLYGKYNKQYRMFVSIIGKTYSVRSVVMAKLINNKT